MGKISHVFIAAVFAATSLGFAADDDGKEKKKNSKDDNVSSAALEMQVRLDRAMFSPGAIDGMRGTNADTALKAFQLAHNLKPGEKIDEDTSRALGMAEPDLPVLLAYQISPEDAATSFVAEIPQEMAKQAEMTSLQYASMQEMLGERFHATPELLEHLNPDATWSAGETVMVPNVVPTIISAGAVDKANAAKKDDDAADAEKKDKKDGGDEKKSDNADEKSHEQKDGQVVQTEMPADRSAVAAKDDRKLSSGLEMRPEGPLTVIVTKSDTSLTVLDKDNRVVFHAPVSAGSEHDPLPLGEWKINGTERLPRFSYNPELFWDAKPKDEKAKLPAGPNSPVGVAWVDISRDHYGLHGTPNPEKIGYTESHGCVRLTNWDVLRLADMVKPETKVLFLEKPEDVRAPVAPAEAGEKAEKSEKKD